MYIIEFYTFIIQRKFIWSTRIIMSVKFETLQSCNGLPAASSRNSKKVTWIVLMNFLLRIK